MIEGKRKYALFATWFFTVLAVLAAPAAALSPPSGTFKWKFTTTVPQEADDIHVTFSGTGGTIDCVQESPAGVVTVSPGNTINVTWAGKLDVGTMVMLTFTTDHSPVEFAGGMWTCGGADLVAVSGSLVKSTPALGVAGLVAMVLSIVLGGSALVGRRERMRTTTGEVLPGLCQREGRA